MVIILVISEEAIPFTRYIYHANDQVCLLLTYTSSNTHKTLPLWSDTVSPQRASERSHAMQELWRYSYPHHKDSVPSWSVPIIALCAPILFITVYSQIWRASRLEVHNAILGGLSCVIFTALVTNLVKLAVRAFL